MDKNMINIDDLLRQRLANGEEKQRPGAWLQMRELLDQQMPVTSVPTAGASFNWRRMFSYLAGLALLATVSVGSYEVITNFRKNATDEVVAKAANSPVSNTGSYTGTTSGSEMNNGNGSDNDNKPTNTATIAATNTGNANTDTDNRLVDKQSQLAKTTDKPAVNTQNSNTPQPGNTASNKQNANTKTQNATIASSVNKVGDKYLTSNNKSAATGSVAANNTAPVKPTAQTNATSNQITQHAKAGKEMVAQAEHRQERAYGSGANVTKQLPAGNGNGMQQLANQPTVAANTNTRKTGETKMIDKVETKETYDRVNGWRKDTVGIGKVEWSTNEPTLAMVNKPASALATNPPADVNAITPNAAVSESNDNEKLLPLSNFKVESKKDNRYTKARRFEQMMKDAKVNMGTVHFYPGLLIGGNTNLGSNRMSGFQLGVTGMLSLNDKWGILSELKYMQRFSQNPKIEDNYTTNANPTFKNGNTIYTYDNVEHYFNYATVSSVELPVAVDYAFKRFHAMGGLNLAYNLRISNVDEYKRTISAETEALAPGDIATTGQKLNAKPTLAVSDFGPRASLGYLLGAAYQMSPAFKLDLRVTQNLIDNAKSDGAKKISKDLYMTPSLQLNMTYRFSSGRNRPPKAR